MRIVVLIFLLCSTTLIAFAQQHSDVGNLKVSGVQLGMSADEAMDALVAHYSIDKSDLVLQKW